MRGIPILKYQGNADVLAEIETRWDVVEGWSAIAFGGTAKHLMNGVSLKMLHGFLVMAQDSGILLQEDLNCG